MNLGTIGTNWITDLFIDAAKQTKGLNLTSVYSRTEQSAKKFAGKHGIDDYFTDLDVMAQSELIDCVYIASPNSLHYEQALLFLKNKKHVICEKPIFSNTRELDIAHRVAEENDVFLFESTRNLHLPNFKRLKESVEKVGKVRNVFLHRIKYSSRYDDVLKGEVPNIFSPEYSGGALVDLGVYPISIAVSLFGYPEDLDYSPVLLNTGVDGGGTLVLNYKDFTCTIIFSKISTSFNDSEINGEKATISIDDIGSLTNLKLTNIHSKQTIPIGIEQSENDMVYEVENFVRIIESKNKDEYINLKKVSRDVLTITETARQQNDIVYSCEK
ncbi:gfo/Idh/MocA family oxidoreductase [Aquibacillus halophilus]|uniref:Gfo/Idh/MocA family oxidoreductase n=1 Tax=Aquibacillus halophilus TaxID=930132 RepID=A0A6A8DN74_9BACI|nr:Gfo/Idh/MocA family oxidoreductase [Aquibacillus halophilus]MRH44487.1 gfo/Idh/MocA family oxidoreductase [Aquibacillus halophilus]